MRVLNGHLELFGLDAHVGLEGGDALRGPVVNGAAGIIRVDESMQLRYHTEEIADVRTGDAQLRSRLFTRVDDLLQGEVRVRLHAPSGARSGNAAREIQPWSAVEHLDIERQSILATLGTRIKEVFVHADETGDDGFAGEIQNLRVLWIGVLELGALHAADLATLDVDALILHRGGARAVDDAHMRQHQHRRILTDIRLEPTGRLRKRTPGHQPSGQRQELKNSGASVTVHAKYRPMNQGLKADDITRSRPNAPIRLVRNRSHVRRTRFHYDITSISMFGSRDMPTRPAQAAAAERG